VFFLLGLYALLTTPDRLGLTRESLLDKFVATTVRALEPR